MSSLEVVCVSYGHNLWRIHVNWDRRLLCGMYLHGLTVIFCHYHGRDGVPASGAS